MKKFIALLVLIVALTVVGMVLVNRSAQSTPPHVARNIPQMPQPAQDSTVSADKQDQPADTAVPVNADPVPAAPTNDTSSQPDLNSVAAVPPILPANIDSVPAAVAPRRSHLNLSQGPQPIVAEADARVALDSVGADPDAEAVWMTAINDPAMPDEARKNLIEDLNENGLSNPDHPTIDDLPLIQSRLDLIEQNAPLAMDDVNGAAFAEAYKDLTKMEKDLTAP